MKTLGALLFDQFELLDVYGPLEAWGILAYGGGWRIATVAASAGTVTSAQGLRVVADHAMSECPRDPAWDPFAKVHGLV